MCRRTCCDKLKISVLFDQEVRNKTRNDSNKSCAQVDDQIRRIDLTRKKIAYPIGGRPNNTADNGSKKNSGKDYRQILKGYSVKTSAKIQKIFAEHSDHNAHSGKHCRQGKIVNTAEPNKRIFLFSHIKNLLFPYSYGKKGGNYTLAV